MSTSYLNHKMRAEASAERLYNEAYAQAIENGCDHTEAARIAESESEDAYSDYFDGLGDYQRDMRGE